eukprot:TRINITY_DN8715_c0_g1_i2.p1 TRINITY_DN8715_c0_g1~~TRINITY_DN8715_c0_g1_i2.p1  ORF type:complete len:391 (+),score=56.56 TRINITY_DN8715_c0_g1_i2:45-1217(+)
MMIRRAASQRRWNTGGRFQVKYEKDPNIPVPMMHCVALRVKDLDRSMRFWQDVFGLEVLHYVKVVSLNFSIAYLGPRVRLRYEPVRGKSIVNLRKDTSRDAAPQPGTMDAHDYLFHNHTTVLKLIELHHLRYDHKYKISSGNESPHLGFGGVGFLVDNVDSVCRDLHLNKVEILAEPTQNDASLLIQDLNGYAVRVTQREGGLYGPQNQKLPITFHTCRLRIRDPVHSLFFYQKLFDMHLLCVSKHPTLPITRYYLCTRSQLSIDQPSLAPYPPPESPEAAILLNSLKISFLELQHHHGTETQEDFSYHSGNTPPVGFAHVSFMVEDVDETIKTMLDAGVYIIKNKGEGAFPQSAYIMDPDGYWVEIYVRCMRDFVITEGTSAERDTARG